MKKDIQHYYWIDLIRFIAAFMVLASHYRGAFFVEYRLLPPEYQNPIVFMFYCFTRLGHEAVLIFFVLSGFLVGGKALDRIHNDCFKPYNYALDRSVRILLPLVSSLIIAVIIEEISGVPLRMRDLIGNILSLQGIFCPPYFDTLWSLSYEVWFYIAILGIGLCISRRRPLKSILGLLVVTICSLVFCKLNAYYLFIWLMGAFVYFYPKIRYNWILTTSILASFILIALLQLTSDSNYLNSIIIEPQMWHPIIEVVFGFTFSIFIVCAIQYPPQNQFTSVINKFGSKLAAFSYTLYLVHIPFRDLLIYLGAPKFSVINLHSLTLFSSWILLAILFSYAIYYLFERNTSRVKMALRHLIANIK